MGTGIQAVAVVVFDASGRALRNVMGKLENTQGSLLVVLTNDEGYDEFKEVPTPFVGTLKLQALDGSGRTYTQSVSIPDVPEVTLRVGGAQTNPQDILLPAAVPFA